MGTNDKIATEALKDDADTAARFIGAWFKADEDNATAADVSKVQDMMRRMPGSQLERLAVLRPRVESMLIRNNLSGQGSQIVLENEIKQMRKSFGYDEASGVERLLMDRIILCWLRVQRAEMIRAAAEKTAPTMQIAAYDKLLHQAHNRYLKSIEELTRVQFLMSRTNMKRLAAVREALKPQPRQEQPGQVIEMRAAGA